MDGNGFIWLEGMKMAGHSCNDWKKLEMDGNGWNGWNGWKWLEIAGMVGNGWK